jgi:hypothetical protein
MPINPIIQYRTRYYLSCKLLIRNNNVTKVLIGVVRQYFAAEISPVHDKINIFSHENLYVSLTNHTIRKEKTPDRKSACNII